jgi:hypothetical protein
VTTFFVPWRKPDQKPDATERRIEEKLDNIERRQVETERRIDAGFDETRRRQDEVERVQRALAATVERLRRRVEGRP